MTIRRFICLLYFTLASTAQVLIASELEENPQSSVQKLSTEIAWQNKFKGQGVTIAIFDSGIDQGHPYFADRINQGFNFTECNDNFSDQHGHGTHIAGIIASMAPEVKILTFKVLDHRKSDTAPECTPGQYLNSITAGFDHIVRYAEKNPEEKIIINASFGQLSTTQNIENHTTCQKVRTAIEKGITVVAAAMNNNDDRPRIPAACEGVIAVASAEKNSNNNENQLAASSNFGPWVKIAAPGEHVLSTQLSDSRAGLDTNTCRPPPATLPYRMCGPEDYRLESGTSMSTAMISASAALLMSINPEAVTSSNVLMYLNTGAETINSHPYFKKINLTAAVAAVPRLPSRPTPPNALELTIQ